MNIDDLVQVNRGEYGGRIGQIVSQLDDGRYRVRFAHQYRSQWAVFSAEYLKPY